MNTTSLALNPLPQILATPAWSAASRPARRRLAGGAPIRAEALLRFNQLLARLRHFPLDRDQLATAARELATPATVAPVVSITQRLHVMRVVERMLAERDWQPDAAVAAAAHDVVDYDHRPQRLLAHGDHAVTRLDSAILIDAAWPDWEAEINGYQDYCRVRALEAALRGRAVGDFVFTRADWQVARQAEAALHAHRRRVATSSYLPAMACARFHSV